MRQRCNLLAQDLYVKLWAETMEESSHHSLTEMEMSILYVADVVLSSRLD